jgi:hypothetical protein
MKTTFGKLTVDSVSENTYKKGIFQAQIRQVVTTEYPSMRVGNSSSDLLFSESSFNIPAGQSYNSTRVTWIPVPAGTTAAQVTERLSAVPDARIYRVISNNVNDVLTSEQHQAISAGLRTLESFKDSLLVRDSEGNAVVPAQYRQNFFSATGKEDVDMRTAKTANVPAAAAPVFAGATIE